MKYVKMSVPYEHTRYYFCESQEDIDRIKREDMPVTKAIFKNEPTLEEVDEFELQLVRNNVSVVFLLFVALKGYRYECRYACEHIALPFSVYVESYEDLEREFKIGCDAIGVPLKDRFEEWYSFLRLFVRLPRLHLIKPNNKRKAIKGTVRQNILMRDNYTCQICGKTVKDGAKLEIDHIIPVSKGGTNNESNLQVLCRQCNREKHNRTDLLHDKLKLEELNNEVKL